MTVFRWINGAAGHLAVLDALGRIFAMGGPEIFAAFFLALWFLLPRSEVQVRRAAVYAVVGGVLALLLSAVLSHLYYRPRPFLSHPELVHMLVKHGTDSSFPSDHAAGSFAFWIGMRYAGRRYAAWFLVIAILVAVARVFVGVHWPTDVLAGAVVGVASGAAALAARHRLQPLADWGIRFCRLAPRRAEAPLAERE